MLTVSQFDRLIISTVELYERYAQSVINDIARRLVKMGKPTATAAWQLQRLTESGLVYEHAISQLAILTGQSEKLLKETFEAAGVKAMRFDDSIYKAAGLEPLPLNLSPAMVQVLAVELQRTKGLMSNLTFTTVHNSQQSFIQAADLAYKQVVSGVMPYDQAIKAAIKNVAKEGLWVNYPSGHRDRLDVAMRRTVLTGVGQVTGDLQIARADEMEQDLVQVSAHAGARPSHAEWQGGIYSRSGTSGKYLDFIDGTGYGTGAGLGGWNCRHSFYPFFEGISKNAYDKAQRESAEKKTVTLNGDKITVYEATQKQRYIERGIRNWKRQAGALEAGKLDNAYEISKVREWQARMRDFIRQTGLNRQYVRERIP